VSPVQPSPTVASTGAKGLPAAPNDEYLVPANKTPWHLDRIDQRELPLDGAYTSSNIGEGVNIYVMSSGVLAEHEEFFDPVRRISRVAPLWGTAGVSQTSLKCFKKARHADSLMRVVV
jgi:hypothetical protein